MCRLPAMDASHPDCLLFVFAGAAYPVLISSNIPISG